VHPLVYAFGRHPTRAVPIFPAFPLIARTSTGARAVSRGLPNVSQASRPVQSALKGRAVLDQERAVENVAFNKARGVQHNPLAADRTHHLTAYDYCFRNYVSCDPSFRPYHDGQTSNLTVQLAVDLSRERVIE
jgi:hypothetical protein